MDDNDLKKIFEEISLLRKEVKKLSDKCHQLYWGITAGMGAIMISYFFH